MKQTNKEEKKKRIKRVFTNKDQVLHLWANQSQDEARCPNVFFEGLSCYSYGRHYELGRLVQYKGQTVALINSEKYSSTTAKHQYAAWDAVSHLPRIKTDDFSNIKQSLINTQGELLNELMKHFSSLKFSKWDVERFEDNNEDRRFGYWLTSQINEFNKTCETLKNEELKIEPDQDFEDAWMEHVLLRLKRQEELNSPEEQAKREKANQRKEELKIEKAQDEIKQWKTGEKSHLSFEIKRLLKYKLLRVKNNEVETSGGARVPLNHALRLLSLIEKNQVKSGEKIGHFKFDEINEQGVVKIGCHSILLKEAQEVLKEFKTQELKIVKGGE